MNQNYQKSLSVLERRGVALVQAVLAGLLALASLAIALGASDAADQNGRELNLSNSGRAWELNEDHNGHLWISDYQAGEIWQLNPVTEVYTAYKGLTGASDGRLDAEGDLWWADYDNFRFGRLDLDTDTRTVWPLTGTNPGLVSGLNFDDQGRVWLPDSIRSALYRFDPQSNEFCLYTFPSYKNSASVYIESYGGHLWLADWKTPYIYRINPEDGSYKEWSYQRSSEPRGMAFDDYGHLWWGGFIDRAALFQLDPNSFFIYYYNLPEDTGQPAMVDAQHGFIWYTDYTGQFGSLDPRLASSSEPLQAVINEGTLEVECYADWQPVSSGHAAKSSHSATWASGAYTITASVDGWKSYHLPETSLDWGPWGIRAGDDGIWVVDQVRQKLVHLPSFKSFLPLVSK